MELIVRKEKPADIDAIYKLNSEVFPTKAEAALVNLLRESGCIFVSLVAEIDGEIVGHILFTPVELVGDKSQLKIIGLAPMAVAKTYQKQGIGTELINTGIEQCRALGFEAVVVLGHPSYYPRFGFSPASKFGIKCCYEVSDDAFMILELVPGSLQGHSGTIYYHPEFDEV
jgi:putative acetyltransferase